MVTKKNLRKNSATTITWTVPAVRWQVLVNCCNAFSATSVFLVARNALLTTTAGMLLHTLRFRCLPAELHPEQVKDYLYPLQQRSNTPSQTYFKHTVYGLRFLLKAEGLPYAHLHLPALPKQRKLPVILSRQELWAMLTHGQLLKHKILIGLLYGCGLRCMEVRNI